MHLFSAHLEVPNFFIYIINGMKVNTHVLIKITVAGYNEFFQVADFSCQLFILLAGAEYDEDLNDEISVQHILRDMLDKNVVEKEILNDLGFDGSKKKKDPRPKMELRHKQVQWASCESVTNL